MHSAGAANLRRELPRIPFASATGAKALEKTADDAALKRRSSTANPPDDVNPPNDGATVEERPFRAAFASKKSRALAPEGLFVADAPAVKHVDVFRDLAKASQRLAEIHVHCEQQPEYKLTKRKKYFLKSDKFFGRSKDRHTKRLPKHDL